MTVEAADTAPNNNTVADTNKPATTPAEGTSLETKPVEGTTPEVKTVVPEKYDLKLPEGTLLEASALERIAEYSKKRGLSNEDAQVLLDNEHSSLVAGLDKMRADHEVLVESWREEAQQDKEFGGVDFPKNIELANRVLKQFFSEKFIADINLYGYGNYPEFIRGFVKIGKAYGEDSLVLSNKEISKSYDNPADILYPKTN